MSTEKFYTVTEVVKKTGISLAYIHQALADGVLKAELKSLKNNNYLTSTPKYVIAEKDLKRFMDSDRVSSYRRVIVSRDPVSSKDMTEVGERRRKLEDMVEAKRLGLTLSAYLELVK